MSPTAVYAVAGGAVLALLALIQVITLIAHRGRSFISTVILGKDGRTSTSKTFVLLWALLVAWALTALLIAAEFLHKHACVPATDIANAATACKQEADEIGLLQVGWIHFLGNGLSGSYLALLALPGAAAVAAKGITQSEATGSGFKAPNTRVGPDPLARVTEIFSADDGTTDIGDFQYMIFNLITAVYFVVQFVKPDGSGLPTISDTLLGLTGVSASVYVGKKAVSRSQPKVTGVFPQPIQANKQFTIIGEGLTAEPTSPTEVQPAVSIDGVPALNVREGPNGTLTAVLPASLAGQGAPVLRHMQVKNPYDGLTPSFDVQCL